MGTERKSIMISTRVPAELLARVDYVVRNSEPETVKNRSTAVLAALLTWLPNEETRLTNLGVLQKKTR
jgi:metal-responsive CopG/Arc/MetJ family transcriptional regulator